MSAYADLPARSLNTLHQVEAWLDARGRTAWIATMVVGFIFVWPAGLAILAFMLYRGKFAGQVQSRARRGSTGNAAFDSYRDETLRRLEEERTAFEAFLERLRAAKDKAEFDQFMDERKKRRETEIEDADHRDAA